MNAPRKILFVCLGNICRSPTAEGIFASIVQKNGQEDEYVVDSAGTSGYHDGELPDARSREHGKKRGYNFSTLSRKFLKEDFEKFDLILVMDDSNLRNVLKLASSEKDEQKVRKLTDFCQKFQIDHVPDPYFGGEGGFEHVLDIVEDACENLYSYTKNG